MNETLLDIFKMILPATLLLIVYLLTYIDSKYIYKKTILIKILWVILMIIYMYLGHDTRYKGQEISHIWAMFVHTTFFIFTLPLLLFLRKKDLNYLYSIPLMIILWVASAFIMFFLLALTWQIWWM